jgi:hypothetical protein
MALQLTKEEKIIDLLNRSKESGICQYLKMHPDCIRYIPKEKRKYDFIKSAIISDGYALRLLDDDEKTLEICEIAISENIYNLRFVPEIIKTTDFLIYAIKCDYNAIGLIENQTEELCLIAMEQNKDSIYLINTKTEKIMMKGTQIKGLYKNKNVPQFYNAVLEYVKQNGNSLQYIKKEYKTYEVCQAAVNNSFFAIKYVPKGIKKINILL